MNPKFVPALPATAMALVLVAAFVSPLGRAEPSAPTVSIPTDRTTYACPSLTSPTVVAGQISPGTSAEAYSVSDGTTEGAPVTPEDGLADATIWRQINPTTPAVVVTQNGAKSGAVGFASGTGSAEQGGGIAMVPCPSAIATGWFVGLASQAEHDSYLSLTNLADEPAAVQVELFDARGVVTAVNSGGVVVPANSHIWVPLSDLAAGQTDLAVKVTASQGAVAASVLDTATGSGAGTEFELAQQPATSLVVTGAPGGAGRKLTIANATGDSTTANVTYLGAAEPFDIEGLSDIAVPASGTVTVDIPDTVDLSTGVLEVSADAPVVAVVRAGTDTDFALGQSADALTGPAAVPVSVVPLSLMLTVARDDEDASVTVDAFSATMESLGSKNIDITAGHTVVVNPADVAQGASYVVVRPSTGTVFGSAVSVADADVTSFPLLTAPVTRVAPSLTLK